MKYVEILLSIDFKVLKTKLKFLSHTHIVFVFVDSILSASMETETPNSLESSRRVVLYVGLLSSFYLYDF